MSGNTAIKILNNNKDILFFINPQMTYWKSVYRKYTKFIQIEKKEETDKADFTTELHDINFRPAGDLLYKISLNLEYKNTSSTPTTTLEKIKNRPNIGTNLFESVSFKKGTTPIDSLDSEYINIHSMLHNDRSTLASYQVDDENLVCVNGNKYQCMSLSGGVYKDNKISDNTEFSKINAIIPLPFSFSRNSGAALPVFLFGDGGRNQLTIEINKHKVHTLLKTDIIDPTYLKFSITCTYFDLSEQERNRFRSSEQEYLMERVKTSVNITVPVYDIRNAPAANLPVKGIYLVNESVDGADRMTYDKFKYNITINNIPFFNEGVYHDLISKKYIYDYFEGCIYNKDHIAYSEDNGLNDKQNYTNIEGYIGFIPFCLKMSEGPSGCVNTRHKLELITSGLGEIPINIKLYIIYYNILSINGDNIKYKYVF